MGALKNKLNQHIENQNKNRYPSTLGVIEEYNHKRNTATISFINPNGKGSVLMEDVQVQISGGGFNNSSPKVGQQCWINFLSNSIEQPVITSLCDENYIDNIYNKKTNTDNGAYINNTDVLNTDTNIKLNPLKNDYFNTQEIEVYEYLLEQDPDEETYEITYTTDKFKENEDGITNLKTKSTIKIDNDGNILIFVNNNIGVKINTEDNSIDIYSLKLNITCPEIIINGQKINQEE